MKNRIFAPKLQKYNFSLRYLSFFSFVSAKYCETRDVFVFATSYLEEIRHAFNRCFVEYMLLVANHLLMCSRNNEQKEIYMVLNFFAQILITCNISGTVLALCMWIVYFFSYWRCIITSNKNGID